MSRRLPTCLGIALGLLLGCHRIAPEASIEGAPQACCSVADPMLKSFKGCRIPRRNCKSKLEEKFWMRGAVECGPVDEAACEGGRCCAYTQQYDPSVGEPIENWAPPGFDEPTNNVSDPDAAPQHGLPAPDAAPSDAAAPATSTPPDNAPPPAAEATPDAAAPAEAEAKPAAEATPEAA